MGFLRSDLAQHVAADGVGEEGIARAPEDRDKPGQHQHQHPHQAPDRAQLPQPGGVAVLDRERNDGQACEHQDQRTLDQDADGKRGPEDRGPAPGRMGFVLGALPGQIGACHRPHRGDHAEQQHGVGLGEPRLDAEQHGGAHQKPGKHRGAPRHEAKRRPIGHEHGADRPKQRRQPVDPDPEFSLRQLQRSRDFDRRGLQPVDADRFLVAHVLLEADVDIIAALDHLLGGLRKARLVAIDRRNGEEAGQEQQQRAQHQEAHRAGMAGGDKVEHQHEPAARIHGRFRYSGRSKTRSWIGLGHWFRLR
ncbi:hypothetical protein ACVWYH_009201 [Bradyrhizobium sp. GM24.11]